MSDIILYGAFDRHNYGDLLFPLIMERVIKHQFPDKSVVVAGLINSDLSEYGAPKTIAINKALKSSKPDATVILAGGDVVACDWQSAYGYLLPKVIFPLYERIACYYFSKVTDKLVSRIVGLTSILPFNLNRNDLGAARKIIYNSVGATGVSSVTNENEMLSLSKVMNEASFVSVRDVFSQTQLTRIGYSSPKLAPDSATVMSAYISVDELEKKSSWATKNIIEKYIEGYIVFQISEAHIHGKEAAFAMALSNVSRNCKLPIVFIAIGNAAGHNDAVGVHKVSAMLADDVTYETYLGGNIFDLMNIIRNAACYCGTSLHGLITAMSFGVPRVALLPNLRKQINYMQTWDLPHMPKGIKPEELTSAIEVAMATPNKDLKALGNKLTDAYMTSFKRLSESF
ncbi:polysaccharide pyruvyl transferase family protein [Colwellia sp. MB02u-18]|uniref:polysaccharide pyruvyl transferase family protein n=1 Tax=unclassified Colwellia TaxID=196834 RepID=UPI0015F49613|nr:MULTISPECIES: polysaccharide pyruvyl transferase family protein [unclassified Colwellia]MBA6225819.1 polysaccharide pyruvyl transferase family protein [Colwellia sp. MB3u-45]MBA6267055.1 polysaccharide pyruvyl transferase family protein [Colwellia sp. MB3u-43]MBA6321979.1 polysaccharide pyruvyl transferase family protein [Colwellia sp. MB02u-19]MBA6325209.1 polysaccharide pyruvyl transferase family protein [Colwellia sp. MB02u-18]MBA6330228.1 polysaccharide pyruvyl transferase family protei